MLQKKIDTNAKSQSVEWTKGVQAVCKILTTIILQTRRQLKKIIHGLIETEERWALTGLVIGYGLSVGIVHAVYQDNEKRDQTMLHCEKAMAEKYGKDAVQDFRIEWTGRREKDIYLN